MPLPPDFEDAMHPVLDRLVRAGWATGWLETPAGIQVLWTEATDTACSGRDNLSDFLDLLLQLCDAPALPELDQKMLVLLDDELNSRG